MSDQHLSTPEQLQAPEEWSANTMPVDMVGTIREMRSRIEVLEKLHTAVVKSCERFDSKHQAFTSSILRLAAETSRLGHRFEATQSPLPSAAAGRVLALQDQIRDGALTLADAVKKIQANAEGEVVTEKDGDTIRMHEMTSILASIGEIKSLEALAYSLLHHPRFTVNPR